MNRCPLSVACALLAALCITPAAWAEAPIKVSVDWSKTIAESKTDLTLIACPFKPGSVTTSGALLHDAEFAVLRRLNAQYVRWHMIDPARQVAEIDPPTPKKTSWDFSRLDADMVPFLEASKGQQPIINFTIVPYWMFKTGQPIPRSDVPADPTLRSAYLAAMTQEPVDPTGEQLGAYFARIVSWYTQGGFTDENGAYHRSGYHYELPWWGVLNEVDWMTPERYTRYYDAIVSAIRAVSPRTQFVGISLAYPSLQPEFFEYFLNPKNHRPGIPLDMVAYHFYAGANGVGGSTERETIAEWQYTFFTQTSGFLSTVRYIESIRKRLSPSTQVNLDELGALLANDAATLGHPEKAAAFPSSYWNLDGALLAYLYVELAKLGIDVATASGIYDVHSLSYTGAPLERDSELTGFPEVSLWISSTAADQDFFVYLEEVTEDGQSTLLTEGIMRASDRATRDPPFDNEGLPWHPGYRLDQEDLRPGVPTQLNWALFPFSNYIQKGHRLRVTINSFDKDGWLSPQPSPAPTVRIYHDAQHPSSITLPFVSS